MPVIVLVLLAAALAAPLVHRLVPRHAALLLAAVPLFACAYLAGHLPLAPGQVHTSSLAWVPELGIELSFVLDGLSMLMALLITGIGALVIIYAGGYLGADRRSGRFSGFLLFFMAAMLGLVTSADVIALFVFWELTSVASYLLIGFDHERSAARESARRALLITGAGGIALLLGLLLLGHAATELGATSATSLAALAQVDVRDHVLYVPALLLVLAGAFTKSAQVPFHFWLPGAMAAPTPVSAYLHSATMVKAGVFLLLRLAPTLGGTTTWHVAVTGAGALTMVTGALLALQQRDMKLILAYSTVSVLGILTMLAGIGTTTAIEAAVVVLAAHALYKAALFMVVGNLDHEAGTRDIVRLRGLYALMPVTAFAAIVAALSKAGAPPLFGFVGKELLYAAKLETMIGKLLILVAVAANVLLSAMAFLIAFKPFFGGPRETLASSGAHGPQRMPQEVHEAPPSMLAGPLVLAVLGIFVGLAPGGFATAVGSAAASVIAGAELHMELSLWHGLSPDALVVTGLSVVTLAAGFGLYRRRRRALTQEPAATGASELEPPPPGPAERAWQAWDRSLAAGASELTQRLQHGRLSDYVAVAALILVALTAPWMVAALMTSGLPAEAWDGADRVHLVILAVLVAGGALAACVARSRMTALVLLSISGLALALLFASMGAPDVAMTLLAVEALSALVVLMAMPRLPPMEPLSSRARRGRDALIAVAVGALFAGLVLVVAGVVNSADVAAFMAESSVPAAHGRNVVNVILVDFRALDTLGEILVVAMAGLAVCALLGLRPAAQAAQAPVLDSVILRTLAGPLAGILAVVSVVVLVRGHNEPGGGFVGGLLMAGAWGVYALAHGVQRTLARMRVTPLGIAAAGLAAVTLAALVPLLAGLPLLTAVSWAKVPGIGLLGTVLLFDTGVYLVVWGTVLAMVAALWARPATPVTNSPLSPSVNSSMDSSGRPSTNLSTRPEEE